MKQWLEFQEYATGGIADTTVHAWLTTAYVNGVTTADER